MHSIIQCVHCFSFNAQGFWSVPTGSKYSNESISYFSNILLPNFTYKMRYPVRTHSKWFFTLIFSTYPNEIRIGSFHNSHVTFFDWAISQFGEINSLLKILLFCAVYARLSHFYDARSTFSCSLSGFTRVASFSHFCRGSRK